ncbi:hypothetical protein Q1695_010591 [Nippostrongylus brasiliensis]|nr:hypothetical protein Q1695_010591 [Nippostrongylus brasiliensis]
MVIFVHRRGFRSKSSASTTVTTTSNASGKLESLRRDECAHISPIKICQDGTHLCTEQLVHVNEARRRMETTTPRSDTGGGPICALCEELVVRLAIGNRFQVFSDSEAFLCFHHNGNSTIGDENFLLTTYIRPLKR